MADSPRSPAADDLAQVRDATRDFLAEEFAAVRRDLDQMRSIFRDALAQASATFGDLRRQTRAQDELIASLIALVRGGGAGHGSDFARFTDETHGLIQHFVAHIQETSRSSHEVVAQLAALAEQLDGIARHTAGVDSIADQTRFLALNATLEAARAGAAGRGFGVVAKEVRALAAEASRFSEQIGDSVGKGRAEMTRCRQLAEALARTDQSEATEARERLGVMLRDLEAVNHVVRERLDRAASVATTIDRDVAGSVTALQFEDIVLQLTGQVERRLAALEPFIRELARADGSPADLARERLERHRAEVSAAGRRVVEQNSMASGSVELF